MNVTECIKLLPVLPRLLLAREPAVHGVSLLDRSRRVLRGGECGAVVAVVAGARATDDTGDQAVPGAVVILTSGMNFLLEVPKKN